MNETPYDGLTPDVILDSLDHFGWQTSGSLLALNSYENRVYQLGLEDDSFVVVKFYRPNRWTTEQIMEEHGFVASLIEHEISCVGPISRDGETLFEYETFRFSVFPRQGGHPPDIENEGNLKVLARTIARIHNVGEVQPFKHRITLSWETMARDNVQFLLQGNWIPLEMESAYESITRDLLTYLENMFTTKLNNLRIHGDCHLGNVLWRDPLPHFVDFDDTLMGPAIQDMWMLFSGSEDEQARQIGTISKAYDEFRPFPHNELRFVEGLRTMRMIHHAAWIARRWHDPAFPQAFPWFDSPKYWSDQVLSLREQLALLAHS